MLMPDVDVLVYAHRQDAPQHREYKAWLEDQMRSDAAYAVSDLVLSGFIRVVTHPRIFSKPSPLASALEFATEVRERSNCLVISP
jgi:predicted nucleic acid-binding protein